MSDTAASQQNVVRPLRVLHVLRRLDTGGIENWLVALMRRIDPITQQWTFLVHGDEPGCHEATVRALGGRIVQTCTPQRLPSYLRSLRELLNESPGFDVIHSHLHLFSGLVLRTAARHVPVRIAHAHNASEQSNGWLRGQYRAWMRALLRRHATHAIAASSAAGTSCFGTANTAWQVLPCGIDLTPYSAAPDANLRDRLGIPHSALVAAHVGRFVAEKNHQRLVAILQQACARHSDLHAVLIGDGPLRSAIVAMIQDRGLTDRLHCLGMREDVPALLQISDRFVFPSLQEGLGLACVEAQACGLPVIMHDALPSEATVVPELVHRLSLSASDDEWATALLQAQSDDRIHALDRVRSSAFNIDRSLTSLTRLYQDGTRGSR